MKVKVIVKPGSKQEKVVSEDDELVVYLHARAHDGEANKALVKILSEHFKVSKSCVSIIRGEKSREKLVEIIK